MALSASTGIWISASAGYLIGFLMGRLQAPKSSPNDALRAQKLQEAFEQVADLYDIHRVWSAGLAAVEGQERDEMLAKLRQGFFTARDKLMKTQVWWPSDLAKPLADFQLMVLKLDIRPLTDEETRMLDGRYRQLVQGFQLHLK